MFRDRFTYILGQTLLCTLNTSGGAEPPLLPYCKEVIVKMAGMATLEENLHMIRTQVTDAFSSS